LLATATMFSLFIVLFLPLYATNIARQEDLKRRVLSAGALILVSFPAKL
jgi:hypothetical protein